MSNNAKLKSNVVILSFIISLSRSLLYIAVVKLTSNNLDLYLTV